MDGIQVLKGCFGAWYEKEVQVEKLESVEAFGGEKDRLLNHELRALGLKETGVWQYSRECLIGSSGSAQQVSAPSCQLKLSISVRFH